MLQIFSATWDSLGSGCLASVQSPNYSITTNINRNQNNFAFWEEVWKYWKEAKIVTRKDRNQFERMLKIRVLQWWKQIPWDPWIVHATMTLLCAIFLHNWNEFFVVVFGFYYFFWLFPSCFLRFSATSSFPIFCFLVATQFFFPVLLLYAVQWNPLILPVVLMPLFQLLCSYYTAVHSTFFTNFKCTTLFHRII